MEVEQDVEQDAQSSVFLNDPILPHEFRVDLTEDQKGPDVGLFCDSLGRIQSNATNWTGIWMWVGSINWYAWLFQNLKNGGKVKPMTNTNTNTTEMWAHVTFGDFMHLTEKCEMDHQQRIECVSLVTSDYRYEFGSGHDPQSDFWKSIKNHLLTQICIPILFDARHVRAINSLVVWYGWHRALDFCHFNKLHQPDTKILCSSLCNLNEDDRKSACKILTREAYEWQYSRDWRHNRARWPWIFGDRYALSFLESTYPHFLRDMSFASREQFCRTTHIESTTQQLKKVAIGILRQFLCDDICYKIILPSIAYVVLPPCTCTNPFYVGEHPPSCECMNTPFTLTPPTLCSDA